MRFRLVPSNDEFFGLFTRAGENMAEAVERLHDLIEQYEDVQAKHQRVKSCEHLGDEVTRTILRNLITTFVTPFDREDIHQLAERVDDVVDAVYHVSEMLTLFPISSVIPELREQAGVLAKMAGHGVSVLGKLSSMKGTGPDIEAIDALESEGDAIYRRTVARLFSGEMPALEVLKWKEIVDGLEDAMDKLEDVADVVAAIVVKRS